MQYYPHSNHQHQLNSQTSFSAENQEVWYPSFSPTYDQFNHFDIFSINPANTIAFDVTNSETLESSTWPLTANSAATTHNHTKIVETESAQPAAPKRTVKRVRNDRHSKICTSQGLRDRRMRLSVGVARKFFSLQDMLGFDKASRTVDWLMKQSESAIENISRSSLNQDFLESTSSLNSDHNSSAPLNKMSKNLSNSKEFASDHSVVVITKESRDMARARARERTREKSRNWSENSLSSTACKQDDNQLVCCQGNVGVFDEYCSPESLLSSWQLMYSNGETVDDFFQEFSQHEVINQQTSSGWC